MLAHMLQRQTWGETEREREREREREEKEEKEESDAKGYTKTRNVRVHAALCYIALT